MVSRRKAEWGCLTANQLKVIALITMTCDHVGKALVSGCITLRIIGRVAFPIFAYMIAEGCRYTKNRKRYFLTMAALAAVCQIVYFVAEGSLYQCVLVTFTLSIGLIYAVDFAWKTKSAKAWLLAAAAFAGVVLVSMWLPEILWRTDFTIDYGIGGILLPLLVYLPRRKVLKLFMAASAMIFLGYAFGGIQWYALASLALLALYNGERGKIKMKNLFYVYYPLHLVVIYAITLL